MCMSGLFGGSKPKAPPPPPAAPKAVSAATTQARSTQRKRSLAALGRSGTDRTGGLLTEANTDKKQLLGG